MTLILFYTIRLLLKKHREIKAIKENNKFFRKAYSKK